MEQFSRGTHLFRSSNPTARTEKATGKKGVSSSGPDKPFPSRALQDRGLVQRLDFHSGCARHVRSDRLWRLGALSPELLARGQPLQMLKHRKDRKTGATHVHDPDYSTHIVAHRRAAYMAV